MKYMIVVREKDWQFKQVGRASTDGGGFWTLELSESVSGTMYMRSAEAEGDHGPTIPNPPSRALPSVRADVRRIF